MIFYHGTTEDAWNKIQEEGILFGVRELAKSRCTYLTTDIDEARQYGEVLLQVEYDPSERPDMNNYIDGCWQCRVYEPIALTSVTELLKNKKRDMFTVEEICEEQERQYNQLMQEDDQYCHPESFKWGFEHGVEYALTKLGWHPASEPPIPDAPYISVVFCKGRNGWVPFTGYGSDISSKKTVEFINCINDAADVLNKKEE